MTTWLDVLYKKRVSKQLKWNPVITTTNIYRCHDKHSVFIHCVHKKDYIVTYLNIRMKYLCVERVFDSQQFFRFCLTRIYWYPSNHVIRIIGEDDVVLENNQTGPFRNIRSYDGRHLLGGIESYQFPLVGQTIDYPSGKFNGTNIGVHLTQLDNVTAVKIGLKQERPVLLLNPI